MKKKTFKRIMSGVFSTLMLASGVCVDVNTTMKTIIESAMNHLKV